MILLVTAGLGATLYNQIVRRHRAVPMLVFSVLDYDAPLPPNAWAQEDAQRLERAWSGTTRFGVTDRAVHVVKTPREWANAKEFLRDFSDRLGRAKPGGPDRNVILVYVSAHGVLDEDGHPVLLLARSRQEIGTPPVASALPRRVRIGELLETIQTDRPAGSRVVLFLDAGRIENNWQLGLLDNGFAGQLEDVVASSGVGELVVVNSTRPGQRAWCFPHRQGSAFGLAVVAGLHGDADENRDGRVTLHELRDYLQRQVASQVRATYAADQTPRLLGDPADFALAYADPAETIPEQSPPRKRTESLAHLWREHERLYPWQESPPPTRSGHWVHRVNFEAFQQGLLRLEQLQQAGGAYVSEATVLQAHLEALGRQLGQPWPENRQDPDAPTLPLALRLENHQELILRERIAEHWPLPAEDARPLADLTPDEVAWAVWDRLLEGSESFGISRVDRALELVRQRVQESGDHRQNLELGEFRLLRQFRSGGFAPASLVKHPQMIRDALRAKRDAERAVSLPTELLAWEAVRPIVDAADPLRRDAQDLLFAGRIAESAQPFRQAVQLYHQARQAEQQLYRAHAIRDRIWMEAPYLVRALAGNGNRQQVQACNELLKRARDLANDLEGKFSQWRAEAFSLPDATSDYWANHLSDLDHACERLETQLRGLHEAFDNEVGQVIEAPEDHRVLRRIRNLLQTPLVTGRSRQSLLRIYDEAYAVAADRTPALDLTALREEAVGESTDTVPADTSTATFWLDLSETPHPAESLLEIELFERAADRSEARGLGGEAAAIRQQIRRQTEGMPGDLQEISHAWRPRYRAARRATAALTLLNLAGLDSPATQMGNPLGELEQYYQAEFWLWQAQRILDDFYGDEGLQGEAPPYFARMAEVSLGKSLGQGLRLPGVEVAQELSRARQAAALRWQTGSGRGIQPDRVALQCGEVGFQTTLAPQIPDAVPAGWAAFSVRCPEQQPVELERNDPPEEDELPRVIRYRVGAAAASELQLVCPSVQADSLPDRSDWNLVAFFRNHVARSTFPVEVHRMGQIVQVQRVREPATRVQVLWEPRPATAALLLDCSESMRGERMRHALDILQQILDELATYPDFSASLWLFGHRRFAELAERRLYQQTWNPNWELQTGEADDPEVTFENDYQVIWQNNADWLDISVGLVGVEGVPSYWHWLDEGVITHFGFTPLHSVMHQAMEQHLSRSRNPGARRLIVLSDGMHNVGERYDGRKFSPPWRYDPAKDIGAKELATALAGMNRNLDEPIRTLLIGDLDEVGELNYLRDVLNEADPNHCQLIETRFRDRDEVILHLRRALGVYYWSVFQESPPRQRVGDHLGRNEVFELPDTDRGRQAYTVELNHGGSDPVTSARLAVAGGETMLLYLEEDAQGTPHLVHRRYRRADEINPERNSRIVENTEGIEFDPDFFPQRFFVAAHTPERGPSRRGWRFPVSIQNVNERRFSPRPLEIWAEVTPMRRHDGGYQASGRPFVFYDPKWETGQAVPVLLLDASPWPAEDADAADVSVWFKQQLSSSIETAISRIRGEHDRDFAWRLDEPAVEFAVTWEPFDEEGSRGWKVMVVERDGELGTSDDFSPTTRIRVDLVPRADRGVRQFFPETASVRHVFWYEDVEEEAVSRSRLRITPVEAIRAEAAEFHLPQPLLLPR